MIEFKNASTDSDVRVATIADVTAYLFKLRGESVWRVTANALGVVGVSTGDAEINPATVTALLTIATVAETRAKICAAIAVECLHEAAQRKDKP